MVSRFCYNRIRKENYCHVLERETCCFGSSPTSLVAVVLSANSTEAMRLLPLHEGGSFAIA